MKSACNRSHHFSLVQPSPSPSLLTLSLRFDHQLWLNTEIFTKLTTWLFIDPSKYPSSTLNIFTFDLSPPPSNDYSSMKFITIIWIAFFYRVTPVLMIVNESIIHITLVVGWEDWIWGVNRVVDVSSCIPTMEYSNERINRDIYDDVMIKENKTKDKNVRQ